MLFDNKRIEGVGSENKKSIRGLIGANGFLAQCNKCEWNQSYIWGILSKLPQVKIEKGNHLVRASVIIEKTFKIPEEELLKTWKEWYQNLSNWLEEENELINRKLKILERKQRPSELLSLRDGLIFSSFSHLDERTNRLKEIGGRGVGGLQLGVSIPPPTPSRASQAALYHSIRKLWQKSMESYIYGNFRACIFQLGSLLEAIILYEISRKKLKKSLNKYLKRRHPTLGVLIGFCDKKELILSKNNNSLALAKEVKKLRNEHIHLVLEKEGPEDIFKVTERDEFIYLDNFEGNPPVEIKNGWIRANGVTVVIDSYGAGILYKYKADAKKCYENMRKILIFLYARDEE